MNYSKKSLSYLLNEVRKRIHKVVRLRDSACGVFQCISCQKVKPVSEMHAGHYYSSGAHPSVRFDLENINGQCAHCNVELSGSPLPYKKGLIKKIGQEKFNKLTQRAKQSNFKFDRQELINILGTLKKLPL